MTDTLLTTKLQIPLVRSELVSRPRLLERLNAGLHCKLTLVSAPAGHGKTTLLSEWARQSSLPVAWLSLDAGDNDPARFWGYLIAALQSIHSGVGEPALAALQPPHPPAVEGLLGSLVNQIAQLPDRTVLVLDDYHLITDGRVNDGLTFLLDNLPPQMHLIVSSRADPPWPLARLRAGRQMIELRTDDLRFTSEEATSFLNNVSKLDLTPADASALDERTEGWIVGLQMASLAIKARLSQGERAMRPREDVSSFIKAFSGSHRFILDYLVEEVLERQPRAVQEFLLKSSILERMSGPLCDAVMGPGEPDSTLAWRAEGSPQDQKNGLPLYEPSNCQAILEHLEAANLFIFALDEERRWYRYHPLFADLLRSRLQQNRPDEVPALHRRASNWYEGEGQIVEAVGHALTAGDVEEIERLVTGNALAVIYHGELATVMRWLDAVPGELMLSRPRLCVVHALTMAYAGQLDAVEPRLQDAERALAGPDQQSKAPALSVAERQHIAGHIAAIRAYVAALKGDWSPATQLAREALDQLPGVDSPMRAWTATILGCALRARGELGAAARAFAEAAALIRPSVDSHVGLAIDTLWEQAVLQLGQGQLRTAMGTCEEALQLASRYARQGGRQLPTTGYIYPLMSHVLYEWNDLETALRYAREGLELCRRWGQADALAQGHLRLARVLHALGETDSALEAIQQAKQAAQGLIPWYVITAGAQEARIFLAQGNVAGASRWLAESGLDLEGELDIEYQVCYATMARILMAQGRLDEALGLLQRLLRPAEDAGVMGAVLRILVLQALVRQESGEGNQALDALERALSLAKPEGYVRVFLDEGAPMGTLLRQAVARGIELDYVRNLLAALDSEMAAPRPTSPAGSSSLVEPLSERELEVLRLLTTPLSGPEIAQELVLSVNTVRSHVKNIYGKLDVHSRREAVARAQDLGLLSR